MNGLELSEKFYEECGKPMLEAQFPDLLPHLAVGLCGSGSECYGYDDEISQDHDFAPGFCIFLPDEKTVDRQRAFALERAYAKLPREFAGFQRGALAPVGGSRVGVLRTAEFFAGKVGSPDGNLTVQQWLTLPDYALAEAINGAIFYDGSGEVTAIRERLSVMPEDVRCKKLAGHLLLMAQAGQYNYCRCVKRGETAAAQLAVVEFVQHTIAAAFLLSAIPMPYYKWQFRALREIFGFAALADDLEYLLTTPNDSDTAEKKYTLIEDIAARIIELLQDQNLTKATCGDLEKHAYSVNDAVADASLRNASIFTAV